MQAPSSPPGYLASASVLPSERAIVDASPSLEPFPELLQQTVECDADRIDTLDEVGLASSDRVRDLGAICIVQRKGAEEVHALLQVWKELSQLGHVFPGEAQDVIALPEMRRLHRARAVRIEVEAPATGLLQHPRMRGAVDDAKGAGGGDRDGIAPPPSNGLVAKQPLGEGAPADITAADEAHV